MTPEQIELLKTTIAKGLSDLELQLFLNVCDRTGLDPFAKQICPVLRWDNKANKNVLSIQVQVDGYRQIAQSTGEYAGCDRALFDEGLTLYEHIQTGRKTPQTCTFTVYRLIKGIRCPFTADVSWDDFFPGEKLGFLWKTKPHQMLMKTSESQALRKAFQTELKHLATVEEAAIEAVEPTPKQVQRSDDWYDMQAGLRTAKTPQEVNAIAQATQNRLPMAGSRYQLEREMEIANERLQMTTIPVAVAEPVPEVVKPQKSAPLKMAETATTTVKVEESPALVRLAEICKLTDFRWKEVDRYCKAMKEPGDWEITDEDARRIRGYLFLDWAEMTYRIERETAIEQWKAFFVGEAPSLSDGELFALWKTHLKANVKGKW